MVVRSSGLLASLFLLAYIHYTQPCRPFDFKKILEPKTCTKPPEIQENSMNNLTLQPGQKAKFVCLIDHSCLVSLIHWYHITPDNLTHTRIKTAKSPGDPHVHTIERVTFEDEGTYSCVAENVIGRTEVFAYLTINTSYSPSSTWKVVFTSLIISKYLVLRYGVFI